MGLALQIYIEMYLRNNFKLLDEDVFLILSIGDNVGLEIL